MQAIEYFLSQPAVFNLIRKPSAGDQEEVKQFVSSNVKKYGAKTVLDVGCGTGDYVSSIPVSAEYLGIDTSKEYLSYAKNLFKSTNRKFLFQDAVEAKFYKGRKFDVVILISILHHLSDKELAIILPQVKKVTQKAVIVTDIIPDPNGWLPKQLVKLDRGQYVRSKEEKLKILKKYFKVKKVEMLDQKLGTVCGIVCEVK